jgi:NAD dependent epimerase/dehydratase family enzyme
VSERVLVTGATGLVGARLVATLAARGDEIVATSRDPERARRALPVLRGAFATPAEALSGVGAIVNLAGESVAGRWTDARKRAIVSSRIDGTRAIVDAIASLPERDRPRVLVSASALGVRVIPLRVGMVMGRAGGALHAMLPLFRAGLGGRIGSGKQWWPWVHVDDVAGIAIHAIDRSEVRGALDATAPTPVRQEDFAKILASTLGRPAFLPAPAFAIRAAVGEFAGELLASRRVLPRRTLESGYHFRFGELGPALADLVAPERPAG